MEEKKETQPQAKSTEIVRKQPNVDTRIKTEDVTARKGLEFKDFGLGEDLMLVSANMLSHSMIGHLRDGLRVPLPHLGGSNPQDPGGTRYPRKGEEWHGQNRSLFNSIDPESRPQA